MASRDRVGEAEDCKSRGNESLKAKDYDQAIKWYTEAIKLHENHVYFSNRSAAYLSKGFADSALKDANKCIEIKSDWPKGYSRKGAALHKLKKYDKSIEAYKQGLALDPNNAGLKSGLEAVEAEKNQPAGGYGGSAGGAGGNPLTGMFSNVIEIAKASPTLKEYMKDPDYVAMLQTVQANPMMMQSYMNDPRFMATMQEVIQADPTLLAAARQQNAKAEAEMEERNRKVEEERKKREAEEKAKKEKEEFEALPEEEKQKIYKKREAVEIKNQGNELYKQKKFKEAIAMYDKAIEMDPEAISFLTNKAAVILETGDLQGCVDLCLKAIEQGRANHADYGLIAKAYARIGNAYLKHKKYAEAIENYKKAQLEKKSPQVAKKLKIAEKKFKEAEAMAYRDPEKAKVAKEEGNVKFKAGDYPGSVKDYSEAINRDPDCAVYYNNRAAAYMKLADFGRAMDDCKKAIEIDPKYIKAFSRKGNIHLYLKEYHKALESFNKGLEIDPENADCKNGVARTNYQIQSQQGTNTEERAKRAMEDPEIRNIMSDPVMRTVLQEMQTDPAAAQKHMSNPEVSAKIQKLIAAGILQTR